MAECTRHIWKEQSSGHKGKIMACEVCGKSRKVRIDKEHKEAVKNGDLIQPNEKQKFIERFGHHPDESKENIEKYFMKKPSRRPRNGK